MANSVVFSRLLDEYGNLEEAGDGVAKDPTKEISGQTTDNLEDVVPKKTGGQLMQTEERNIGAVTWAVYRRYLQFAGGVLWVPLILLLLTLFQSAQGKFGFPNNTYGLLIDIFVVGNTLFLAFWTSTSIPGFKQGDYIAVYASLGNVILPHSKELTDFYSNRSRAIILLFLSGSGICVGFPLCSCICP